MCSVSQKCVIIHKGHRPRNTKHEHWQHSIGGPVKCAGCQRMRKEFKNLLEKKTLITHKSNSNWVNPCNSLGELIQKTLYEHSDRSTFVRLSDIKTDWNVNCSDMDKLMWQIIYNEWEAKKAIKVNQTWVRKERSFLTGSMTNKQLKTMINQSEYDNFVRKDWNRPDRWVGNALENGVNVRSNPLASRIFNCHCSYHNEYMNKITRWDSGIYIKLYCIE